MREYGKYLSFGLQLVVVLCLGLFGGQYFDKKHQTSPLWTLVGFGVSYLVIVWNFVILVRDLDNKDKDHGFDKK